MYSTKRHNQGNTPLNPPTHSLTNLLISP
jgi:hypothetical protein